MLASYLLNTCLGAGIDFFSGVPDSQLKPLCDAIALRFGVGGRQHVVAANEGNAVALCAGHYLATGRPGLCYMQNSGLGNAVNPLASLMDEKVYGLPCLLVIGWRGEPGVKDEPQHAKQGLITLGQLELMDVPYIVLEKGVTEEAFDVAFAEILAHLQAGRTAALVVRKGALQAEKTLPMPQIPGAPTREEALAAILDTLPPETVYISTTGKLSRELFELREQRGEGHGQDFLTVGSMGHASSIALGVALSEPSVPVCCLDGDGAALMHLGALGIIGQQEIPLIHIVINNGCHESVGGMPVAQGSIAFRDAASVLGYRASHRANSLEQLRQSLTLMRQVSSPALLEVLCSAGSRENLGRPTATPQENRDALMTTLREAKKA